MRICVIGPSRFPVREPFAGGLEAFTHTLAGQLAQRGHEITLFAAPGSDPMLPVEFLDAPDFEASPEARADVGANSAQWMSEHHAYLSLMVDLAASGRDRFDVVLNCCIHPLPVATSRLVDLPIVTTLHTPPTDVTESALQIRGANTSFITVSEHMQRTWGDRVDSTVIRNGVDTDEWRFGPGGPDAIWFGRIVPEKGTELAIRAALQAGLTLDIAGPRHDREYFEVEVSPLLGERVRYLGHLEHSSLREAVRHAKLAFVTPRWNEPYGLVAAEALASGTPVAGFARGALPEILTRESGRLAPPDDIDALAEAGLAAAELARPDARRHAERFCSIARMVDEYEFVLGQAIAQYGRAGTERYGRAGTELSAAV